MEGMILHCNILCPISTSIKNDAEHEVGRRSRLRSQQVRWEADTSKQRNCKKQKGLVFFPQVGKQHLRHQTYEIYCQVDEIRMLLIWMLRIQDALMSEEQKNGPTVRVVDFAVPSCQPDTHLSLATQSYGTLLVPMTLLHRPPHADTDPPQLFTSFRAGSDLTTLSL